MTTLHERPLEIEPRQAEPGRYRRPVNIGRAERLITGAAGAVLAFAALRRPFARRLLLGVLGGGLLYRAARGYCPAYHAIGVDTARRGRALPEDYFHRGIHAAVTCTIDKPAGELFRFWRNFENLPAFMRHLQSVHRIDERRSHWVAAGPGGAKVEWDAQIINEEPDRLIAWESLEGADVHNAGSVRFLPILGSRGTEVHIVLDYIPPAGRLGSAVAWLFGRQPQQQIRKDLRHFKKLMESP